jgi:chromosome segregation ATPase
MDSTEHTENGNNGAESMRLELEEARTRIDLYEFQIANLRSDLEQIKMHAVLTELGGAPQFVPPHESVFSESMAAAADNRDDGIDSRGMKQNLDAAMKTVASFDRELQDAKKTIVAQQQRISDLENTAAEERKQISSEFETVIKGLETDIRERENRLQSIEPIADAHHESENLLRERVSELEDDINKKNEEIAELQQNFETRTAAIAQELEQRLALLEEQIKEKEAGILAEKQSCETSAGERINELSERLAALNSDAAARDARIEELENELSREREIKSAFEKEAEERIDTLKREHDGKIHGLADEISAKNALLAGMERDRDDAHTAVKEDHFLRTEFLELQQQLLESQKRTDEAKEQICALQVEMELKKEMELRLRQIEARLEEAAGEYRELEERYNALKKANEDLELERREGEQQGRDVHEEHAREIRDIREEYEKRLTHHTGRLQGEYLEIRQIIQQRETVMDRLREQISTLSGENKSLSAENRELVMELADAKQKVQEYVKQGYDDVKQKMLDQFIANPSPAVLIELRRLFLDTRRYLDAVRTFRQVLVDPRNQKYTPAVCLLVGEFYKLAGRADDAAFYLANPLIKEDSYAQYLLRKITAGSEK